MERVDWKRDIIPKVGEIVGGYSYRPTLRQVFYRLVAALLIPNTEVTYKSLSRATVIAREEGSLNPLSFDDRVRTSTSGDWGYTGIKDFIDSLKNTIEDSPTSFTLPMWDSQSTLPVIWLEKDALFTPVSQVATPYRVKVYAARGYSSFTAVYQAAQEITGGKPTRVLQLTDFDPSGEDMVRDLEDRLTRYGALDFTVTKIALTQEQVADKGLPPMPAKTSDPRYDRFATSYGEEAVELDALPPGDLEAIVSKAITECIDQDEWNIVKSQIKASREDITARVEKLTEFLDELD